jgi:hypothetical protein
VRRLCLMHGDRRIGVNGCVGNRRGLQHRRR